MALSLREAVFIAQDSELKIRRDKWIDEGWCGNGYFIDSKKGSVCDGTITVEDILADDWQIVRPDGSVARMPDTQGPASREPG